MARLDLTDEEREELIEVLRDAIENDRYGCRRCARRGGAACSKSCYRRRRLPRPPRVPGGASRHHQAASDGTEFPCRCC
jgi:hypothetical protein